jgi:autotransporter-associated beta strand protein
MLAGPNAGLSAVLGATYTISSAISGNGSLNKHGAGKLALLGMNSYTGPTLVHSGVLSIANLANGGMNSSLGASASDPANLVISDGATLQYTGAMASSDRGFTIGAGSMPPAPGPLPSPERWQSPLLISRPHSSSQARIPARIRLPRL